MTNPWLTPSEAAAALSTTRQFVYEACSSMGLEYSRLGKGRGMLRIRQSTLEEWVAARTTKPA